MLKVMAIRPKAWYEAHTHTHLDFSPEALARSRRDTISICLPARNEARTIAPIIRALLPLRECGLIDQLVVVDDSSDDTAEIARRLGAEVHSQADLMPELGPPRGKGDAMWRSLTVLQGELICFLDADSEGFGPHFAYGLLGPLITQPAISFVKGFYRRPFRVGATTFPDGGGRVTELTARPLLNLFYPDLAGVEQPLAGELAARRSLLEQVPFVTGYGVDIALLLDAYRAVGLAGLAQVDLDVRQNAHQSLRELGPMAHAVLHAVATRLEREGRLRGPLPAAFAGPALNAAAPLAETPVERPPLATLRRAA
jgi:glucosyl-3-phosphoglycerate synthase